MRRASRPALPALVVAALIAAPALAQTDATDAARFAEPPPSYGWLFEPPSTRVTASMTDQGLRSMLDHMVEQLDACEDEQRGLEAAMAAATGDAEAPAIHSDWVGRMQNCATRLKASIVAMKADLRRRVGPEAGAALDGGAAPADLAAAVGLDAQAFAEAWEGANALEPRVDALAAFAAGELRAFVINDRDEPFHQDDAMDGSEDE